MAIKVNKYHLDWQIVRLRARQTKDVFEKTLLVLNFYHEQGTELNRLRILNWAKMTKLGYAKDTGGREHLEKFEVAIANQKGKKVAEEDNLNFDDYAKSTLKELLKDLKSRKWSFQFKQAPKDHIEFIAKLEEYING